jgi:hypothetical protein
VRTPAGHDAGTDEFIRRFLIHVLPRGFHRIRHYGLLASSTHKEAMALARRLLGVAAPIEETDTEPTNRPIIARHAHVAAGT